MKKGLRKMLLAAIPVVLLVSACTAEHKAETAPRYVYGIEPGDVLQITVWKEEGMDKETLVLPDGTITFPLVGSLTVRGMTPEQVQETIKQRLRDSIPHASVSVMVKAALGHTVNVTGQVTKPGEIVMGHGTSVMQAISQAGGLTPYADEHDIKILRRSNGKEMVIPFDYSDVTSGHKLNQDITLYPGDVIVVPTAGLF
ncbi:MAG TPA: polysaccharide biosynthesis/export family protein [Rickettsiales bacterium]|nr:polysaccharide biosynthesis/export family protein [Rickettsiales bacterium]